MTKKDFIRLANVIRDTRPTELFVDEMERGERNQWNRIKHNLAECLAEDNPNFNRQRWLDYIDGKCGPNGGKL